MSFADSFERRFLFVLTRGLALLFIFGLLAAIVIGGMMVSDKLMPKETTAVTPQEVVDAITPPKPEVSQTADPASAETSPPPDPMILPGIKLPFVLQKHFSAPERIKILRDWLEGLASEQRQIFLDEMAAAVTEAEKNGAEGLAAIDKYKEIKFDKLKQEELAAAKLATARMTYAGVAFGAILLIALFSLILVLLAIERNTRRSQA
jgi:cytoskeletal protein RodZ